MIRRRAHRIGSSRGPRRTVQEHSLRLKDRFTLTHRLFFRAGSWDYQHSTTAQRSILEHVSICSPSIRSPAWETAPISVRVIDPSVSLTAERPFSLQGTHVIPILFWSQFTTDVRLHDPHRSFFFRAEARTESHMGDVSRLLFISTAEHRLAADRSKQIFLYALPRMRGHLRC